ncbi:MAG: MATE family efflux transporter [Ruminococcaceae bacterium]|nr:MATE family efflux transporter [Oscillospiraceae bacterium]
MRKIKVDMTEGPFLKKMIIFAIPLILTGVLQCLYNAADLVVVGRFRGDLALAAVGSTGNMTNLITGLFMGLSVGAGVLVAHHVGAKEYEDVNKVVHTSVLLAFVMGIFISICGIFLARPLLSLMDTPENVLPHATLYMKIIFLGIPAMFTYNYIASMMRSSGDSKHPLMFLSISGVINVVLNLILVCFFGMSVEGVAIATITSQYSALIMFLVHLMRDEGPLHLDLRKLKIHTSKVPRLLYIGIPSGLQSIMFALSNVFIQSFVNAYGDEFMAGSSASGSIEGFVYIAMNAFYHVSLTFVGQNVGARKYKNIKTVTAYSTALVTALGILIAVVTVPLRRQLLGLYVTSDAAMEAGLLKFMILVPTYFLCGIMEVLCGALRALGKSVTTMIISTVGVCGLRILWLQTVCRIFADPAWIFISYIVTWIVAVACLLFFLILETRKVMRRAEGVKV